jgi:hypothetical protein
LGLLLTALLFRAKPKLVLFPFLLPEPLLLCLLLVPLLGLLLLTILFFLLSAVLLVRALPLLVAPALLFLPSRPVGVDRSDHLVDRPFAGDEPVDPMQIGEPDPKAAPGLHVFDAERDDDLMALAGDRDLAADVFVLVAMLGEDQQHCPAGLDRLDDFVVEWSARAHVARRDPTRHAQSFQLVDDFERGLPIFVDMADEQEEIGVGHSPGLLLKPGASPMLHAARCVK